MPDIHTDEGPSFQELRSKGEREKGTKCMASTRVHVCIYGGGGDKDERTPTQKAGRGLKRSQN